MGRNIFDAIGDMFRADPENVAQRQETKRARIAATTERQEQRQDTGTKRREDRQASQQARRDTTTERQKNRQDTGTKRLDIRTTGRGDRLQTKAENPDYVDPAWALATEAYEDAYDSMHAVGSSVLGAFGLDVEENYKQDEKAANEVPKLATTPPNAGGSGIDASEYETADIKVGGNVSTSTKLMFAAVALGAIYAVGKK
jgi:hypothetical protein